MDFDLAMTDELLATTRAVRRRLDLERPVPREVINECLELSIQAPTGANSQLWRWMVVDDAETRSALANLYREAEDGLFTKAEARSLERGDEQSARVYNGARYLADVLDQVPVHVIPCLEGRPRPDTPVQRLAGLFGSIFPAVWSFQLALRSRGLGSTLTTIHLQKEQEVADLLGLPDNVLQVALLPVAYTKGTDFKRAPRPPASTITHWNHW